MTPIPDADPPKRVSGLPAAKMRIMVGETHLYVEWQEINVMYYLATSGPSPNQPTGLPLRQAEVERAAGASPG